MVIRHFHCAFHSTFVSDLNVFCAIDVRPHADKSSHSINPMEERVLSICSILARLAWFLNWNKSKENDRKTVSQIIRNTDAKWTEMKCEKMKNKKKQNHIRHLASFRSAPSCIYSNEFNRQMKNGTRSSPLNLPKFVDDWMRAEKKNKQTMKRFWKSSILVYITFSAQF